MAKMFLNRAMAISTALNKDEVIAIFSSRSSLVPETTEQLHIIILEQTTISVQKFNTTGLSLLLKFKSPGEKQEPRYISRNVIALTNYITKCEVEI
jgi:ABC-type transporter Mla MlaB component